MVTGKIDFAIHVGSRSPLTDAPDLRSMARYFSQSLANCSTVKPGSSFVLDPDETSGKARVTSSPLDFTRKFERANHLLKLSYAFWSADFLLNSFLRGMETALCPSAPLSVQEISLSNGRGHCFCKMISMFPLGPQEAAEDRRRHRVRVRSTFPAIASGKLIRGCSVSLDKRRGKESRNQMVYGVSSSPWETLTVFSMRSTNVQLLVAEVEI